MITLTARIEKRKTSLPASSTFAGRSVDLGETEHHDEHNPLKEM
jgi:hypothetical protein